MKLTKTLKKVLAECKIRYECDHCDNLVVTRYATRLGFNLCLGCFVVMHNRTKETTKELQAHKHIKLTVGCQPPKPSADSRKRRWVVPKGRRIA